MKEEIEEVLNNRTIEVPRKEKRFKEIDDPILTYKTTDLPTNRPFLFLTLNKKMVEKEIKSSIHKHRPAFDLSYCLVDSTNVRYWLSRNECKFILMTNSQTVGQGTVFLYPTCKTSLSK
ncbi:MAG: hypothetical protein IPM95_04245 [Sphingobacteriales bacterium]|nr:hypothetical protein [Sphingobacteriales bacterium]